MPENWTKGPWKIWQEVDSEHPYPHLVYIPIGSTDLRRVGATGCYGRRQGEKRESRPNAKPNISEQECRANAHLIAASPDLYEALKAQEGQDEAKQPFSDLECFIDDPETREAHWPEYQRRMRNRAALKRARGESDRA